MTTQQVWKKYADDVKHFILSKVKDTTVTDDLLQETFIKVHTKLHTLNDITKLKPWIFTIARNTMMDYFKTTNQTIEFKSLEVQTDTSEHEHTEKDCLHAIIQGLPKKYRDPLFLSDIKGLKQQEVADTLKQNLPTTKSQIQRARKLIAQGFMDCCGFSLNEEGKLVGEIQDKENCKVCK
ncbi:sigma-70 family RNA polymerase sigma factor [Tenacibaculum sp. 1B UA]|uniref:sigma-70 family RNA polymerase sigma factor n=1 Tax=Tenacibaculum sp. 1B UA TaxID=2922252 RepID=UPI002A23B66A|nr:sigma-70 family RNA polymerase sigma factor [Tenacibaculum sp. 1B UA]MDX8552875.1 sigma-70 family RNA polymerase sigma factor [Tenacibaculum sp. 1B UA]